MTRVLLIASDPERRRALSRAISDRADLELVGVRPTLASRRPRRFDVILVDLDLDHEAAELVPFERLARRHPVLATSVSLLRTDIWMLRGCGAAGYGNAVDDLPDALRTVAAGEESWPRGLGAEPSWLALPLLNRICRFTREREQARYARLIHDHVLQTLEGLALSPAITNPELRELLAQEAAWLRLLVEKRMTEPPRQLFAELESVVAHHRTNPLDVELTYEAIAEPALTPPTVRALADATNEALRNTTKHAAACTVRVAVASGPDIVSVRITDSGVGFDSTTTAPGFGLTESITAQMQSVGGTAIIHSVLGQGTVVRLTAPILGR